MAARPVRKSDPDRSILAHNSKSQKNSPLHGKNGFISTNSHLIHCFSGPVLGFRCGTMIISNRIPILGRGQIPVWGIQPLGVSYYHIAEIRALFLFFHARSAWYTWLIMSRTSRFFETYSSDCLMVLKNTSVRFSGVLSRLDPSVFNFELPFLQ